MSTTERCEHGFDIDSNGPVTLNADGLTSCCGAYSTIFTDTLAEYCKCCWRDLTDNGSPMYVVAL